MKRFNLYWTWAITDKIVCLMSFDKVYLALLLYPGVMFLCLGEVFFLNSCRSEPFSVEMRKDHAEGSVDVGETAVGNYVNGYSQIKRLAVVQKVLVHTWLPPK